MKKWTKGDYLLNGPKLTRAYHKKSKKYVSIDLGDERGEYYYNIYNSQIYTKDGSMNVTDRFIMPWDPESPKEPYETIGGLK